MPSKIEWTDETWNFERARNKATGRVGHFCVKVSAGCQGCYAERLQKRFGNRIRYAAQDRDKVDLFLDEKVLTQPLRWRKPRVVFPCSMTDLFGEWVSDDDLHRAFAVMSLTPRHTYKVLTKRPERMRDFINNDPRDAINAAAGTLMHWDAMPQRDDWPMHNVQLFVSVEDQPSADARVPLLLDTPAAVRGVSYEPALGPVDFTPWLPGCYECGLSCGRRLGQRPDRERCTECGEECGPETEPVISEGCPKCSGELEAVCPDCGHYMVYQHPDTPYLDQVIAGGQSGPEAEPSHPAWFRQARDQCVAAGVPFFFKQWGEWLPDAPLENGLRRGVIMKPDGTKPTPEDMEAMMAGLFDCRGFQHFTAVGKKAAGRVLDGRTWDEAPEAPASAP